ncbi:hypothetical protein SSS_00643 [Sarcoptes scabiei]|uniref:Uncharacterized protein n=1 Tax=Sarcoptes scabiei TaxID=52283 RepID=A0A834R5U6_SARSC|nr:hypothetical protein SSS_00643 [Sarcoptes scabiei]UXI17360.1 26S proteasome non-ATPase regulatory [Sarcoptes scabiei]
MDLKGRLEVNQLIKEKINEKISKRESLKQELRRLNNCRVQVECQINEQHKHLHCMNLRIDDPFYDRKLEELDDSMKFKATSCRDKIYDLRKELDVILEKIKSTFIEYNKLL